VPTLRTTSSTTRAKVDGFERELGDELCARAGLTCEWVTNDWDSIIPNLHVGQLRHDHRRHVDHRGA
jgi:ABC-type amino acid transport substrate-binding protein